MRKYGYDSYEYRRTSYKVQMNGWAVTNCDICTFTAATSGTITVTTPKPPAPVPFREGERVRVETDGFLDKRVGVVAGFMMTKNGRLAFVNWPGGGWSTFYEPQLERVDKKGKPII